VIDAAARYRTEFVHTPFWMPGPPLPTSLRCGLSTQSAGEPRIRGLIRPLTRPLGRLMSRPPLRSRHIERLERELAEARERVSDRDNIASQLTALQAVLEIERKRADEIREDRDHWWAQAERLSLPALAPARRGWWPFRRAG
jgi:hypothetical protein